MIHTTGAAPKKPPCPECGKPGTQVPASSPLLPEIAPRKAARKMEDDTAFRRRLQLRFGPALGSRAALVTGADLDKLAGHYAFKRKEIEP